MALKWRWRYDKTLRQKPKQGHEAGMRLGGVTLVAGRSM